MKEGHNMASRKHNRVDEKGRVVIPVKIREAMEIDAGSFIEFEYMARKHQLVIRAVAESDVHAQDH
ncbi:hypothetical protein FD09_GL002967 [Schleiferilactobacillus perolens DSM 12744]|jgi:AbrB family looped-hinge helix DNA binding protein|uniref:SpoVT-AbrB domain-containing protein n=2 Tax=Schleiferilactobacillus perolens TaxID=100468 RepID=A0A0R1N495_9LACO|nr:hypothetical protein FD09_GL002967 [Schleiferilactobacillus perolens DSM 12744]